MAPVPSDDVATARRALITGGVLSALVLVILCAWFLGPVLLTLFGAVLFAIFLRAIADPVHRWTRVPAGAAALLAAVALVAALALVGALAGPPLADQVREMTEQIPQALDVVGAQLERLGLSGEAVAPGDGGGDLLDGLRSQIAQRGTDALGWVASVVGSLTGALAALVFVVLAGIYLAVQPRTYRRGLVVLLPQSDRSHASGVLRHVGRQLRGWLFGQLSAMTVVGVLTGVGLVALGISLAPILAVLAFLFAFVPNIGPVAALVLAILVTLVNQPDKVWWVIALYLSVQFLESYLVTPLIQRRAADIPPALLLAAQLLFGAMYGLLGLLMAAPLTAAILVLVQQLWRGDVLGDEVTADGAEPSA
jgi:predicted PurR-regulated permease PerM